MARGGTWVCPLGADLRLTVDQLVDKACNLTRLQVVDTDACIQSSPLLEKFVSASIKTIDALLLQDARLSVATSPR